ncbi:hypothetical protein F2Q70_00029141 [Brassica cretica]|uniref:Cation/H+ exchanger domain-containing protein n=1 Tax=Brassica cretica TaxID=69181 RepID=A0A8S9FF72_BRACR|nr:hypothetical protein F2Q70_00029141 [Brassica cretica]
MGYHSRNQIALMVVINGTAAESNATNAKPKEDSFADMIDRALEKEFPENDQNDVPDPGSFNNSVADQQAVLETVARVKPKKNETKTKEEKSFFNLDNENGVEDTPRLIDRKDNVFIMSNPKSKYPVLQLDLRLISDLVVVIVSATCGGIAFACAGQPVITGYLLAGSVIGPGGLSFVSEMVQVETVAQFGVIFLLFALGLEFSAAKLRVVRAVAIPGGLLQIFLFMCLSGITASLCGGKLTEGIFVGAFLSMSSTAVVLKFLMERNSISALHGQITVGTLILQDCAVGLLFALLPVLGGTSGVLQGMLSMAKSLAILIAFLAALFVLSRTWVPWFLKLMTSLSSQTNELYQLAAVAFCLLVAWCSDKLGLSLELGSFAAGVMISTTDLAQHTLEQVEPIRNFFAALFLASIGMLIHMHFLWNHVDILVAAVLLVIVIKTVVVAIVVKVFGYNNKTAVLVGMSLAQIGEFAFVLLSRASNLHLIESKLYLLLLGTTALSLVTTPFLFKLIPAVVHLGVLLRWFSPDSSTIWQAYTWYALPCFTFFNLVMDKVANRPRGFAFLRYETEEESLKAIQGVHGKVETIRNFFAALFLASIGMLIHMHFLWNHVDILVAAVLLECSYGGSLPTAQLRLGSKEVEPIRNFFAALFLASIGMLIHMHFLWNHVDILVAAVLLVIVIKTVVVAIVVKVFGYNNKTAVLVGMSLAQIGEFAFVLLSRASNLHLIESKLYLLLLGTTALSLVTTPFLFKLIPAVVHLGVLLRWFSPDSSTEIGFKGGLYRSESAKLISQMIQGSLHDS